MPLVRPRVQCPADRRHAAGYIRYIDGQSLTRCLSFLNIGMHGLAGSGGAYAHVNQIKVEPAVDAIRKYPEHIVGVKILLTAS